MRCTSLAYASPVTFLPCGDCDNRATIVRAAVPADDDHRRVRWVSPRDGGQEFGGADDVEGGYAEHAGGVEDALRRAGWLFQAGTIVWRCSAYLARARPAC